MDIFYQQENKELCDALRRSLRKTYDTPQILLRFKKCHATYRDWIRLFETLDATWHVSNHLDVLENRQDPASASAYWLSELKENIDRAAIRNCFDALDSFMDIPLSKANKQIEIKEGADPNLDKLKLQWHEMDEQLQRAAEETVQHLPQMHHVVVEFVGQIGYHVVIPSEARDAGFIDEETDQLEFMFEQESKLYFKNDLMRHLDDTLGDVPSMYRDRMKELLRLIDNYILDFDAPLSLTSSALSELDATMALSEVALNYDLVRPKLVEDSSAIMIKDGFHPLVRLVVSQFVPNDCLIGGRGDKMAAIVTGPNYSGDPPDSLLPSESRRRALITP